MLQLSGPRHRLCDGLTRRSFLTLGAWGACGWYFPARSAHVSGSEATLRGRGVARRCILLFLTGGPPQHDTWDMKPRAAAEVRGELHPIDTNVPGIQISELFPSLACHADKYCLVRSVTHADTVHTSAGYTMLTGAPHPQANTTTAALIRTSPNDHPHVGALVARYRGKPGEIPTAVSLPEFIRDANVNDFPGQGAGFLGKAYAPLLIEADSNRAAMSAPPVELPGDLPVHRIGDREKLRQAFNAIRASLAAAAERSELNSAYARTLGLLSSARFRAAFDVAREPAPLRDAYGSHLFGQGCLLARRLVEAGVTLVTVYWHYEGPDDSPVWDTHWNNYPHLRNRLMPPTDRALAALLEDLAQRGLLADTLVLCLGEFGRTPRINKMGGRDHWPHVQSILMAGGGIRGGQVYGASDAQGAFPADKPVAPADLIATILHLLGVPPEFEVRDLTGRTLPACHGKPLLDLLA
jgi:hypothetical protein